MAERRMFAKTIIDSDAFLDMPASSQALYFHLSMRADDDGFINNPKKIMRIVGSFDDDLRLLCSKKFIIPFESGVVVIKHWKIHNYIRKDTYKETYCKEEKAMLEFDENTSYRLRENAEKPLLSECRHSVVDASLTQDRLGQDSLGKDRLGQDSLGKDNLTVSKETVCSTQDVQQIIDYWNTLPEPVPKIKKISKTSNRYKMLIARIKEYGVDEIENAIENVRTSDFLLGKVKEFIVSFDWFVKPNNFIKVLEGNYNNSRNTKGKAQQKVADFDAELMKFIQGGE